MTENSGSATFPMADNDWGYAAAYAGPYEQMRMDLDSFNLPFEWVS